MGTVILRPGSDGYVSVSASPSSYAAYQCINEVVADDDTSYIYGTATTTLLTTSRAYSALTGNMPTARSALQSAKLVYRAKCTGGTCTVQAAIGTGTVPTAQTSTPTWTGVSKTLGTSYITYEENVDISALKTTGSVQTLIDDLADLWLSILMTHSKASSKDATVYAQVTQAYLELTYAELQPVTVTTVDINKHCTSIIVTPDDLYQGDTCTITAFLEPGYALVGWYTDAACTQLASKNNPYTRSVTEDIMLYAATAKIPNVTVVSQDTYVISDEVLYDACNAQFVSDTDLISWEARAYTTADTTHAHGSGLLVESGSTLAAGVQATVNVLYTELSTDADYVIYIFGQSADGVWSDA